MPTFFKILNESKRLKNESSGKRISNQEVANNLDFQFTAQQIGNILAKGGIKPRTQRQATGG